MQSRLLMLCLVMFLAACGTADTTGPVVIESTPQPVTPVISTPTSDTTTSPTEAAATTADTPDTSAAEPPTAVDLTTLTTAVELVAEGFEQPLYVTGAGDDTNRLFVVQQRGAIAIIRDGQPLDQPFLDITNIVGSSANEQGLLSIAFHPDYARTGQFFVNYTNLDGNTMIARYRVSDDPDVADPTSAEILLTIEQPAANHNGGLVKFGPDGYLYVGMGDGGRAGDPWGNAQNRSVLLGKLLRLDVDGETSYTIPADNPFVEQPDTQPEIWAWGLRNPWRFSFDRATGDLYIADVGQNSFEEVHFQPASSTGGENYGWDIMEGAECFQAGNCDQSDLEQPIVVYGRSAGCSITGGYTYRGSAFPDLTGVYVYADYCSGTIWGLHNADGAWQNAEMLATNLTISSFGEDEQGELYVTDHNGGGVYRLVAGQ